MDLAEALRDAGGVVAGGSALGAGAAWTMAMLASDLGRKIDVTRWVERGAGFGAVAGFAALIFQFARVR